MAMEARGHDWKVKKDIKLSDVIKKVKNRIGHEWKSLARGLGLNTSEIAAIEYDNRFSLKEQIAQLFIHWERTEGPLEATPQALVNGLMKENLTGILEFLERDGYVENIGTSRPIQVSQISLPAEHQGGRGYPIQESEPPPPCLKLPESELPPPPPKLLETAEEDTRDVEPDEARTKLIPQPALLSPEDEKRRKIRIKRLARFSSDNTGEKPIEEGDMVMVDSLGYGVVKWLGELKKQLIAGIEFEKVVPGGGCGDFGGTSYFTSDPGCGLFLPYEKLKRDGRFLPAEIKSIESETVVDSSSTYTSSTLDSTLAASNSDPVDENQLFQQIFAELRTSDTPQNVPSIEDQCKYPGCSMPKYVESGQIHDFCGKRHAEMSKKEQLDRESSDDPNGLVFYIPEDRAGLVIGKDGKNILEVERATNTIIKLQPRSFVSGGRRVGVIMGSEENCKKAALMILKKLERKVSMHTATSKTIKIPQEMVGRVIGKNGVTIDMIKSLSGVHDIKISDRATDLAAILSTERECTIAGSDEQIEKAVKLITQVLSGEDIVTNARIAALKVKLKEVGIDLSEESSACVIS